jgi:uncharacterized membrane protein YfcA
VSFITLSFSTLAVIVGAIPFSMLGQGGGTIYVPILIAAGIETHEAITISLFMIVVASLAATYNYNRRRTVDWKLVFLIVPFAILGGLAGGFLGQQVDAVFLQSIVTLTLFIAAYFMIRPVSSLQQPNQFTKRLSIHRIYNNYDYNISLSLLVPGVILIGFISSLIGIGGGLFLLPLLVLVFGLPIRIAIGVSSVFIGFTALSGFIGHLLGGSRLDLPVTFFLATAAFIGSFLGSHFSLRTTTYGLRYLSAAILVALAGWMAVNMLN